jgi:hypothetical protein
MSDREDDESRQGGEADSLADRIRRLENEAAEARKREETYRETLRSKTWMAAVAGVLVVCAVASSGIAIWQASKMRSEASSARQSAEAVRNLDTPQHSLAQDAIQLHSALNAMEEQTAVQKAAAQAGSKSAQESAKQVQAIRDLLNPLHEQLGNFQAQFEKGLAARLTFDEPQITTLPHGRIEVTLTVRNAGQTVADEVQFQSGAGAYNLDYNPNPPPAHAVVPATPGAYGPSIAPGQTRVYKTIETEPVEGGHWRQYLGPSVSYRDVFGIAHRTTECWTYVPQTKNWVDCPNNRQH